MKPYMINSLDLEKDTPPHMPQLLNNNYNNT